MNGKIIQVVHGTATYKCNEGHVWSKDIDDPFDPRQPSLTDPCYQCTQASIKYRTASIGDLS